MSIQSNRNESKLSALPRSTVIAFLFGAVIPLFAAMIPQGIEYLRTRSDFSYSRGDPVLFDKQSAYLIEIKNNGRVVEKDVQVWIGNLSGSEILVERDLFDRALQPFSIKDDDNRKTILLGDMRPGETIRLSILRIYKNHVSVSRDMDGALISYPAFVDKVVSSDRVAQFIPKPGTVWDDSSRDYWRTSFATAIVAAVLAFLILLITRKSTTKES